MSSVFDIVTAAFRAITGLNMAEQGGAERAHVPSYADICVVRAMLQTLRLPAELVLEILDFAQYEPVIEFPGDHGVKGSSSHGPRCCLRAEVLGTEVTRCLAGPHATPKVKEIRFDLTSRDQGWASDSTLRGTYNGPSWSEISIFRPSPGARPLTGDDLSGFGRDSTLQTVQNYLNGRGFGRLVEKQATEHGEDPGVAWHLQSNKVLERQQCDYQVVWSQGSSEVNEGAGNAEGFFETLQQGDEILVWARAMVRDTSDAIREQRLPYV